MFIYIQISGGQRRVPRAMCDQVHHWDSVIRNPLNFSCMNLSRDKYNSCALAGSVSLWGSAMSARSCYSAISMVYLHACVKAPLEHITEFKTDLFCDGIFFQFYSSESSRSDNIDHVCLRVFSSYLRKRSLRAFLISCSVLLCCPLLSVLPSTLRSGCAFCQSFSVFLCHTFSCLELFCSNTLDI